MNIGVVILSEASEDSSPIFMVKDSRKASPKAEECQQCSLQDYTVCVQTVE